MLRHWHPLWAAGMPRMVVLPRDQLPRGRLPRLLLVHPTLLHLQLCAVTATSRSSAAAILCRTAVSTGSFASRGATLLVARVGWQCARARRKDGMCFAQQQLGCIFYTH